MSPRIFQRSYPPARATGEQALWLLFRGGELVAAGDPSRVLFDGTPAGPQAFDVAGEPLFIGTLDDRPCFAGLVPPDLPLPPEYSAVGLRAVLAQAEPEAAALAGYAAQLLHWTRTSRFCPACAQPLGPVEGTWGRVCPNCGHSLYPPVSPAVIVLIHDQDRVLLTTKEGWGRRYSLVAGFVEPGETLEDCVKREVREEVGVDVTDLRYFGSQAWPFPHQIMIGFTARYAGGSIAIDRLELTDAAWFTRDALPELPPPFSIARQILEHWRANGTSTT